MEFTTISNNDKSAIIYLPENLIEEEIKTQLLHVLSNNSVNNIRLMPDCHPGHGCLVGFTAKINIDKINPNFIGGDIGCGILTYPLGNKNFDLYKIEEKVRMLIPMSNDNKTGNYEETPIESSYLERYLERANIKLQYFYDKFENEINDIKKTSNVEIIRETINIDYFDQLLNLIRIKKDACLRSFGTLGGGNHFIEINIDENTSEKYLSIHSGSRNFGMKLFHHHCMFVNSIEKSLLGKRSLDYIADLILAQELATMNRHIMLQLILREINVEFDENLIIQSVHNYIDFDNMILRKGAISANANELCILALNMRDGILICEGIGNENWNYSCAHGCGRLMTRNEARKSISLKKFKKSMKDIITSSVNKNTLDEAPDAYKDYNLILNIIDGNSVNVKKLLRPVVNWKG